MESEDIERLCASLSLLERESPVRKLEEWRQCRGYRSGIYQRRYLHDKGGTPPQTIHLNRGISSASTSGMISAPADVGDGEKSETKKVLIVNVAMTDEPKAVVSEGSMKEASI
ncbi:hypothetical protein QYF36_006299 [Acer negundo]|nr:hypothetical protein QYF36_006299 [Acer negundo]